LANFTLNRALAAEDAAGWPGNGYRRGCGCLRLNFNDDDAANNVPLK
jgi:hypothetical protein